MAREGEPESWTSAYGTASPVAAFTTVPVTETGERSWAAAKCNQLTQRSRPKKPSRAALDMAPKLARSATQGKIGAPTWGPQGGRGPEETMERGTGVEPVSQAWEAWARPIYQPRASE